MAEFQDGHKKIEGSGRQKGVKNQNKELRMLIRDFHLENWPVFIAKMKQLEAKEYCTIFKDLFKYDVPTVSAIKFEDDTEIKNASMLIRSLMNYDDEGK